MDVVKYVNVETPGSSFKNAAASLFCVLAISFIHPDSARLIMLLNVLFGYAARFSPDDKYSRQRVLLKKRFGLLPTQKPPPKY